MTVAQFQIGKNGLTEGVMRSLELTLKNHKQIRISVLKSAARDKNKVKEIASQIVSSSSVKLTARIIGFTIILKKSNK